MFGIKDLSIVKAAVQSEKRTMAGTRSGPRVTPKRRSPDECLLAARGA